MDNILEALKFINVAGLNYQEWINVGMALKRRLDVSMGYIEMILAIKMVNAKGNGLPLLVAQIP